MLDPLVASHSHAPARTRLGRIAARVFGLDTCPPRLTVAKFLVLAPVLLVLWVASGCDYVPPPWPPPTSGA